MHNLLFSLFVLPFLGLYTALIVFVVVVVLFFYFYHSTKTQKTC